MSSFQTTVAQLRVPHLVVVYVIEGRGLSGLDSSGTSDAACVVELGPTSRRRQTTLNQPETNNALWEKTFIFDHIWLTEGQFAAEKIALKVFDRNTLFRDALIGSVEISFSFVYRKKSKCLSRQWLGLYQPNDPATIHGYILASVYILRPGDPPPTLIPSPSASLSVIDSSPTLKLPKIRYKPFHLNILVYRAEKILADKNIHLNPFVSVRFNGNTIRTSSRSNQHNPIFNRRFEMPFYIPTTSDSIEIMLWNETSGRPDVLIASTTFSQNELTYKPWGPKWISFYTSPSTTGFLASLMESFKPDVDVPCEFAGRLLVRLSVSPVKRTNLLSMPLETITDEPSVLPYLVKFQLYSAADLSVNAGKLAVEIDFAGNRLTSAFVGVNHGTCAWNCNFKSLKAVMSVDLEQIPDVIISIIHRVGMIDSKIAFIRLPVNSLFGANTNCAINADQNLPGESWTPAWRLLQPIRSNDDRIVPGLLLFTIGIGRASAEFEKAADKAELMQQSLKKYRLSSTIQMAANLPPLADIGLANAFAVVRVAGVSATTSIRYDTLYPVWNEDINFEFSLVPGLTPRISILIYHSSGLVSKSLICRTDIAVPLKEIDRDDVNQTPFRRYALHSSDSPNLENRDSFLIARFQVQDGNSKTLSSERSLENGRSRMSVVARQASFVVQGIGVREVFMTKDVPILSQPQLEVSVPDFSPGAPPGHMISKTIEPTSAVTNGSADFRTLVRFDDICLPQQDLDCFSILIRLYDRRATGRARIGFRHVKLEDIWSGRNGKGQLERRLLEGGEGSHDTPWLPTGSSQTIGEQIPAAVHTSGPGTGRPIDVLPSQLKQGTVALDIDSLNIAVSSTNPIRKDDIDVAAFNSKSDNPYSNNAMPSSFEQDLDAVIHKDSKTANSVMKLEFIRDAHAVSKSAQTSLLDISKGLRPAVGHLKAVIMAGDRNDMDLHNENNPRYESLSQAYAVRLYIYRGISFNPQQSWIGEHRRMQPYLVIKNGMEPDHQINDRASSDAVFEMDDLNPEFARSFQLQCRFPENAILNISVWNRSFLTADRLIGSTSMDLEQRVLNPLWHALSAAQRQEQRPLLSEGQLYRGKLELRADVVGWQEALETPLENLSRSEPEPYELRLVLWASRDIRWPADNRDDEIDQFITCTANFDGLPGSDTVKSTDTAWGSGPNADWNYRMVFPITLPCKVPRLRLTVWDADIFGRTVIGDVIINLAPKLTETLRERRRIMHIPGQWLHIEHPDAQGKQLGDIHVEMWALAKNEAEAVPVGEGQNNPNRDPFLASPSRKPPPWAVGSRLLNTLELFSKRKNLLMALCCLLIAVPLIVPLVFGKLSSAL